MLFYPGGLNKLLTGDRLILWQNTQCGSAHLLQYCIYPKLHQVIHPVHQQLQVSCRENRQSRTECFFWGVPVCTVLLRDQNHWVNSWHWGCAWCWCLSGWFLTTWMSGVADNCTLARWSARLMVTVRDVHVDVNGCFKRCHQYWVAGCFMCEMRDIDLIKLFAYPKPCRCSWGTCLCSGTSS